MFIELDDGNGIVEITDEEAAVLAVWIISSQAHIHVHYWANGVAQLIDAKESSWALAKESNDLTQWMNHAALFAWSPFFTGLSQDKAADMFENNMNQG